MITAIALLVATPAAFSFAAGEEPPDVPKTAPASSGRHALGLTAGAIGGIGLAYSYAIGPLSLQVGGGSWTWDGSEPDSQTSAGLKMCLGIDDGDRARLYGVAGFGLFNGKLERFVIGAGGGMELKLGEHVRLALELTLAVVFQRGEPVHLQGLFPAPGASLLYYF
jgi:hypothetical protein